MPFLLGFFLALFALYLRRSMEESEVFDQQETRVDEPRIPRKVVVRAILLMIGMTSGVTAAHYTWTSYVSTYAITQKGMDADTAYWMLVIAQVIALVSLPFWGRLSDRIGRRPMLGGFAVLMFALQIPLTSMITSAGWTLLVATTVALLIVSVPGAILSCTLSESFPTRLRTQAIGFAYSFSVAVFGGTAPYLNQLLTSWDIGWIFGVYIMALCVATGIAALIMKETKGIDLHKI